MKLDYVNWLELVEKKSDHKEYSRTDRNVEVQNYKKLEYVGVDKR